MVCRPFVLKKPHRTGWFLLRQSVCVIFDGLCTWRGGFLFFTVGSLSAKAAEGSPRDRRGEPQNAIVMFSWVQPFLKAAINSLASYSPSSRRTTR